MIKDLIEKSNVRGHYKKKTRSRTLIAISFITFIIAAIGITQQIFAEKDYDKDGILEYKNWDGKIINEKQHHFRIMNCIHMKMSDDVIDVNTNCHEWVLTSEGESMIYDYVAEKYLNGDLSYSK